MWLDVTGCAHAVARHVPAGRPVTIEPGAHRKTIALLAIAALRLSPDDDDALRKLGFERIEQLIGAPRGPLAKRFGRELHRRLDQALGTLPEPIEPIFPDQLPRARRGFMEPIATAEAFAKVIGDLAHDIADQLGRLGKVRAGSTAISTASMARCRRSASARQRHRAVPTFPR